MSVCVGEGKWAACVVNPTTGAMRVGEFALDEHLVELRQVLAIEAPAELVRCLSRPRPVSAL
jgi:hypothetical protein